MTELLIIVAKGIAIVLLMLIGIVGVIGVIALLALFYVLIKALYEVSKDVQ